MINIRLVASCWFLSLHPTFMMQGHKSLKFTDPVFITSAYNESYYIDRTLCLQKCSKEDIFTDKTSKDFPDVIASGKTIQYTSPSSLVIRQRNLDY